MNRIMKKQKRIRIVGIIVILFAFVSCGTQKKGCGLTGDTKRVSQNTEVELCTEIVS